MSKICGAIGSFTDTELLASFAGNLAILPVSLPSTNDLGLVDISNLDSIMVNLKSRGILPNPPDMTVLKPSPVDIPNKPDPLAPHIEREKELVESIKEEYCFYESRYFYALDSFLQALTDSSTGTSGTTVLNQRLENLKMLNKKLNIFIQITNRLAKQRYQNSQEYDSKINSINSSLQKRGNQIREQADIYNRESVRADMHKRLVEYTKEKNYANYNLLALYGVLNLVAIGILVYISKK